MCPVYSHYIYFWGLLCFPCIYYVFLGFIFKNRVYYQVFFYFLQTYFLQNVWFKTYPKSPRVKPLARLMLRFEFYWLFHQRCRYGSLVSSLLGFPFIENENNVSWRAVLNSVEMLAMCYCCWFLTHSAQRKQAVKECTGTQIDATLP